MALPAAVASPTGPTLVGWEPRPPRPRVPLSRIGCYRLLSLLDEGASGSVYLAEGHSGGRVAIKVLWAALAGHASAVARFVDEVHAARAVRHPNVVEVLDWGTLPDGCPYMVMELLGGEKLSRRLDRGPLAPELAVEYAVQTASALAAIHIRGMVHRDLKPDNLFVVPNPCPGRPARIKVLDFGIVKLQGRREDPRRTQTGALMGTPLYMSPEQCAGIRELDARSDLYALGLILYEMLCGHPPFVSEMLGEIIDMHLRARPEPLRRRASGVPARLAAVVDRALAKEPADRFACAAEMAAAARAALG